MHTSFLLLLHEHLPQLNLLQLNCIQFLRPQLLILSRMNIFQHYSRMLTTKVAPLNHNNTFLFVGVAKTVHHDIFRHYMLIVWLNMFLMTDLLWWLYAKKFLDEFLSLLLYEELWCDWLTLIVVERADWTYLWTAWSLGVMRWVYVGYLSFADVL